MTTAKGLAVKVEIALTFSTAKTVTAVSKADPGVATSATHGMTDGTVGFWTVTAGMTELDGQASRVKNGAGSAFDLQGLDTTNYTAFTSGTFTPAATWGLLDESVSYEIGGGAANALDDTRLIDVKTRNVNGLMGAQNLTIGTKPQTVNSSVMAFIEKQARAQGYVLVRITLHDGSVRVAYGQPSMPGESVQSGALASGSLSITVPAWVLKGAA
jgi:hypothetical protein